MKPMSMTMTNDKEMFPYKKLEITLYHKNLSLYNDICPPRYPILKPVSVPDKAFYVQPQLLTSPSPSPSQKSKPQVTKSPIQKGKGEFELWAVTKITRATIQTLAPPNT